MAAFTKVLIVATTCTCIFNAEARICESVDQQLICDGLKVVPCAEYCDSVRNCDDGRDEDNCAPEEPRSVEDYYDYENTEAIENNKKLLIGLYAFLAVIVFLVLVYAAYKKRSRLAPLWHSLKSGFRSTPTTDGERPLTIKAEPPAERTYTAQPDSTTSTEREMYNSSSEPLASQ